MRASARKRFRATSNVPAPAPSGPCCEYTSSASSHQHRRRFGSSDPRRLGSFTTSEQSRLDERASAADTETAAPAPMTTTAASAIRPRPTRRCVAGSSERRRARATTARHDNGTDEREHAEDGPVRHPIGTRRDVLRQRRPREGPGADENRRPGRRDEQEPARHPLPADREPQRDHSHRDDDTGARERQQQRERGDVDEQRPEHANGSAMRTLRAEPEAEHDRDVGEQRERVPVLDRLAKPRDAVSFGVERGNGLRDERVHERRADDERERRSGEPRSEPAPDGREHHAEPEKRAVRDRLVERVPAAVADDRPAHRHADPQRERHRRGDQQQPRAPDARNRNATERDGDERGREHHDGRTTERKRPADVRSVAGEHRADQDRADEPGEHDCTEAGRPDGGLRPRIHGEPR